MPKTNPKKKKCPKKIKKLSGENFFFCLFFFSFLLNHEKLLQKNFSIFFPIFFNFKNFFFFFHLSPQTWQSIFQLFFLKSQINYTFLRFSKLSINFIKCLIFAFQSFLIFAIFCYLARRRFLTLCS